MMKVRKLIFQLIAQIKAENRLVIKMINLRRLVILTNFKSLRKMSEDLRLSCSLDFSNT